MRSRGVEEVHLQCHVTLEGGTNTIDTLRHRIDAEGARSVIRDVCYRCHRVKNECDTECLTQYLDIADDEQPVLDAVNEAACGLRSRSFSKVLAVQVRSSFVEVCFCDAKAEWCLCIFFVQVFNINFGCLLNSVH